MLGRSSILTELLAIICPREQNSNPPNERNWNYVNRQPNAMIEATLTRLLCFLRLLGSLASVCPFLFLFLSPSERALFYIFVCFLFFSLLFGSFFFFKQTNRISRFLCQYQVGTSIVQSVDAWRRIYQRMLFIYLFSTSL